MHVGLQHITVSFDRKCREGRAFFFCEHLASCGGDAHIDRLQEFVIQQRHVVPQRLMTELFVLLTPRRSGHLEHLAHEGMMISHVFHPIPVGVESQPHDA